MQHLRFDKDIWFVTIVIQRKRENTGEPEAKGEKILGKRRSRDIIIELALKQEELFFG